MHFQLWRNDVYILDTVPIYREFDFFEKWFGQRVQNVRRCTSIVVHMIILFLKIHEQFLSKRYKIIDNSMLKPFWIRSSLRELAQKISGLPAFWKISVFLSLNLTQFYRIKEFFCELLLFRPRSFPPTCSPVLMILSSHGPHLLSIRVIRLWRRVLMV